MTDWRAARDEFPALATQAYLNTAAGAPLSRRAAAAGSRYYEASCADGDVHWDDWLVRVESIRSQMADLIGADADQIAFVQNASAAMNLVAGRLEGHGDVLLVRGDFPSVTYPWMAAGHGVQFVEPDDTGLTSLDALAAALTPASRILAVGLVHYRTGGRYDLAELSGFCQQNGLALIVDATQGLGAVQVDVEAHPVDYMVCSGYKWLTSGYGFGILYAGRQHLDPSRHVAAGWRSAREPYALVSDRLDLSSEASAMELGHPPFAGVFALGEALGLLAELGPAAIEARVLNLSGQAREILAQAGLETTPATPRGSGIVYASCEDGARLRDELLARGVYVSARGAGIRCSTHFYNDESDLARLREALAAIP